VDHDVAGEQCGLGDERDVVVGVARRVHHLEFLVADLDRIAVVDSLVPSRVVAVGVQVGVEGVEDRIEFRDVVTVLVGEDDLVDVVDVVLDGADDARIGAGVDQRRGYRPRPGRRCR